MNPPQQVELKLKLFLTTQGHDEQSREDIATAIGGMLVHYYPFSNELEKKEFESKLLQVLQDNTINSAHPELVSILRKMVGASDKYFKGSLNSRLAFLKLGLHHYNILIRWRSIRNLADLLKSSKNLQNVLVFRSIIPDLLQCFEIVVQAEPNDEKFNCFLGMIDSQLRFFQNHLK